MSGTALIDADILVHQYASASARSYDWGDGATVTVSDEEIARKRVQGLVNDILENTECGRAILCLSDPKPEQNWRRQVLPTYKNNRVQKAKPKGFWRLRDFIERSYITRQTVSLEADDLLGILLTGQHIAGRKVCCSIDKDLLTVPGLHYQWKPTKAGGKRHGVFEVTAAEARHRFYTQVLTGDPTDGYHGIPGCGPACAMAALEGAEGHYWKAVVRTYEAHGLTENDALVQARCARILRVGEYTPSLGVLLWRPEMDIEREADAIESE